MEKEMSEEWREQIKHQVNTLEKLANYINVSEKEREAIEDTETRWGTSPHFASLMDRDDPNCPIRKQVIPSAREQVNEFGMMDYLVWKENRSAEDDRPDSIARQYHDRIAFTITRSCAIYCRHCFRKELVVDRDLDLNLDIEEGLAWIGDHPEIRDVLITGGDPLLLSDEKLENLVERLREIPHIEIIRIGSRLPVVVPHRITEGLKKAIGGYHRVPVWINTQVNHPKEITEAAERAVYELLSCGINVGNQAVLLKDINDDVETFRELHQKLLRARIRPYYLFYCEPAPGSIISAPPWKKAPN